MMGFIYTNWISLVGAVLGLCFLYLEYRANAWMWLASIFMAVFYIYIFYRTQLYASMGIYIYFLGASVYGGFIWLRTNKIDIIGEVKPTRSPKGSSNKVLVFTAISFLLILLLLYFFTINNNYIKIGDALTTALNIVALWMMSKKWAEQWLLVIPANLISSILLYAQDDILSAMLFFIYFVVSIAGYDNWKKMAKLDT